MVEGLPLSAFRGQVSGTRPWDLVAPLLSATVAMVELAQVRLFYGLILVCSNLFLPILLFFFQVFLFVLVGLLVVMFLA